MFVFNVWNFDFLNSNDRCYASHTQGNEALKRIEKFYSLQLYFSFYALRINQSVLNSVAFNSSWLTVLVLGKLM